MLRVGGVDLTSVAADFGTPTFVLDVEAMRGRARVWASAMAEEFWGGYGMNGGDAFYAGKAFLSADVARLVAAEGLGIDTASLGELSLALRAGVDPDRIGLHGNNKSDAEIRLALEAGIHRIFIDSMDEVHQIERIAADLGVVAPVMVRLKSGIHAGGNEYIATAHEDQKFGLSLATGQAYEAVAAIKDAAHLDFRGLHSHIGSQIFGTEAFAEAARIVIDFAARLKAELDLDVSRDRPGRRRGHCLHGPGPGPDLPGRGRRALATVVRERCAHHGLPIPHVSVEPGRSIAGPSMVMLYRVGVVKDISLEDGGVRRYVAIDGGMSDNIRPVLYDAAYTATLANRDPAEASSLARCRIVGKHCESGDIIIRDIDLPADIAGGDLLAVPAVGAYGYSMASNYNMLTKPGVLAVEDGSARWFIRPQTSTICWPSTPAWSKRRPGVNRATRRGAPDGAPRFVCAPRCLPYPQGSLSPTNPHAIPP